MNEIEKIIEKVYRYINLSRAELELLCDSANITEKATAQCHEYATENYLLKKELEKIKEAKGE